MNSAGRDPAVALAALTKKRFELGYVTSGGEVKPAGNNEPRENKITVVKAIADFLADCHDRQGKSGYGLAPSTVEKAEARIH